MTALVVKIGRWPILFALVTTALAVLYKYGPSRTEPRWRWITWGSVSAAIVWLAASVLFSWYVASFGSYNKTYGSLGAVIGFMTWIWISIIVVLVGAKLNAEMEHQTVRESTTGQPKPIGRRGARRPIRLGQHRTEKRIDGMLTISEAQRRTERLRELPRAIELVLGQAAQPPGASIVFCYEVNQWVFRG